MPPRQTKKEQAAQAEEDAPLGAPFVPADRWKAVAGAPKSLEAAAAAVVAGARGHETAVVDDAVRWRRQRARAIPPPLASCCSPTRKNPGHSAPCSPHSRPVLVLLPTPS